MRDKSGDIQIKGKLKLIIKDQGKLRYCSDWKCILDDMKQNTVRVLTLWLLSGVVWLNLFCLFQTESLL